MSFWRFKFATGNTIDSLLNALPTISNPPSLADITLFDTTLDSLLAAPDLLSEIKSGTNQKLRDFLARDHVVQRLGGWVLWGLGGEEVELIEGTKAIGIVADDIEDGKVPDDIIGGNGTISKKKLGMGRIIRRRDMDLMGTLEGGTDETEEEKACNGHPRLCTEILSSDVPGLTDMLFNHEAASSQPETCASPISFILPFWEALLRSTEVQLETRSIQVGYWARVNSVLLNGPKGLEVLAQILTIPHILPRLLALLPFCSPINDILLLLLRTSKSISSLTTSLIPQTLRMLDPQSPPGKEGHVAAEELLRGVIELCSAAAPPLPPPLSNGIGEMPPAHLSDGVLDWRENTLARQIAAERSIQMVVDWILAGTEQVPSNSLLPDSGDAELTPKVVKIGLPTPSRPIDPLDDLRTSSLVQSISVLIDLIRKNNSDFVEQQMLTWARKKETEEREKELDDEITDVVDGFESTKEKLKLDSDRGPSLVDLGPLLRIIAGRLGGFQELIKSPRSPFAPISTTAGIITPLTQERFRICEFYAELLHCSNMSLVNRPISLAHLYDSEGYLAAGWKAADDLSDALAGVQEQDEQEIRMPSSPGQLSRSTYDTSSPVEIPMNYSSGLSTPSGNGSLDSESGILTRAEVKELNQVVAGALAENGEDDEDPFGDPSSQDGGSEYNDTTEEFKSDIDEEVTQNGNVTKSNHSIPDYIPPGLLLKKVFMEHRVIETVLDMFFDFPWNNFLHNVVFDIIQQIFHGRIDRELDRKLVLSVFLDGRVIDRILGGQRANDIACARPKGTRLGYMGHMSLIAEEVVKLFHHYPSEVYSIVEPHIPQPDWDHYVTTTLRETRERDLSPLGGGVSMISHETASSTASGLSDEDDEFPERGVRGRAVDLNASSTSSRSSTIIDEHGSNGTDGIEESAAGVSNSSDKFSQYLANAISSDRADKFGSSDEDDEDDDSGWLGGTRFDPKDVDFALSESSTGPTKFGFEDRFELTGKQVFRSTSPDSDDDADWGPYSTDSPAKKADNFSTDDEFSPTVSSTSVTFESSFSSFGTDDFASSSFASTSAFPTSFTSFDNSDSPVDVDDDDFGDFETGSSIVESSSDAVISLPLEVLSDFDFEETSREIPEPTTSSDATTPTSKTFSIFGMKRPSFERTITADDGSDLFGGLSLDESEAVEAEQVVEEEEQQKEGADKATTLEESLGPNMHEGSHLKDGMVESLINGEIVRVPADDIALAHGKSEGNGAL